MGDRHRFSKALGPRRKAAFLLLAVLSLTQGVRFLSDRDGPGGIPAFVATAGAVPRSGDGAPEVVAAFVRPDAASAGLAGSEAPDDSCAPAVREPAPVPFGVGEYLEFSVSYNIIRAGTATLSVEGIEEIAGHRCYKLVSTARSNGFVSTFFEVRDRVESLMDVHGLFSRKFEKHLKEGGYTKDEAVWIDHCAGLAYYGDGDTVGVRRSSQDALSALYFVRTLDLQVGNMVVFPSHSGKKNYPMRVRVLGKEKIKTPVGHFNCIVVEPRLKSEGIFKHKGRLIVWLSDDERRIPVRMKSQVTIGSITASLVDWKAGSPLASGASAATQSEGAGIRNGNIE
jgi:hypothetical protein